MVLHRNLPPRILDDEGMNPPRLADMAACSAWLPITGWCHFCELDFPDEVVQWGTALLRGDNRIADFGSIDELTRQNGFLVDGSYSLEYPFSDGLSDIEAL